MGQEPYGCDGMGSTYFCPCSINQSRHHSVGADMYLMRKPHFLYVMCSIFKLHAFLSVLMLLFFFVCAGLQKRSVEDCHIIRHFENKFVTETKICQA